MMHTLTKLWWTLCLTWHEWAKDIWQDDVIRWNKHRCQVHRYQALISRTRHG